MINVETTKKFVHTAYQKMDNRLKEVQKNLHRPLTLAEKIFLGHLAYPNTQDLVSGKSSLKLSPDRVAMQDVTAQMALLQFLSTGKQETVVPIIMPPGKA